MKIAYFDCFCGISGDMVIGAFLDLGLPLDYLKEQIAQLEIPKVDLNAQKINKKGISATKFDVVYPHEHVHRNFFEIEKIILDSTLSDYVKTMSIKIFTRLAQAEGKIHDQPLEKVHFHEVGAIDSIIDIVGAAICFEFFGIDKIFASKISVGCGTIKCAHGIIPVPVPAVVELFKDVPIVPSGIETEIVTPTGAAILTTYAEKFGYLPEMIIEKSGFGAGHKDLDRPNVLRVILGNNEEVSGLVYEDITVIETNIDDMNPQFYEYILEKLFAVNVLDVFLTPIIMKKSRPGTLLTVLCKQENLESIIEVIIQETTSIGVRYRTMHRLKMQRKIETIDTSYGEVRIKISESEGKILSKTPEYQDCVEIARKNNIPLKKIYSEINRAIAEKFEEE
jgi:pyridinium-3,5-bisthiocarboxylic acid mononucleotide nickel chelatase